MLDNQTSGVSIGQKDTDNLIRDNEIRGNKEVGVLFRALEPVEAPHRNRVENNRILDSGSESGVGVDVQGKVEEVTIAGNEIRETRQPGKRIGVRIGANSRNVTVENNRIEGFAVKVSDLRKPSA
jgi:nitrous oxidase accessory protein NosD